jgi:hypothetical protein
MLNTGGLSPFIRIGWRLVIPKTDFSIEVDQPFEMVGIELNI